MHDDVYSSLVRSLVDLVAEHPDLQAAVDVAALHAHQLHPGWGPDDGEDDPVAEAVADALEAALSVSFDPLAAYAARRPGCSSDAAARSFAGRF